MYFDVFSFEFIEGDKNALMQPKTIVLTDKVAEKYFGSQKAVGKSIRILNNDSAFFLVTAVVKEFPSNSHFHFNMLASMSSNPYSRNTQWVSNSYFTYLVFKTGADPYAFEKKIPQMVKNILDLKCRNL
ncbi:MAG: ABC transporter permease [Bacteroidetes bacterium]|nr:ABC transporter permease [Bacteroidota bacterium]